MMDVINIPISIVAVFLTAWLTIQWWGFKTIFSISNRVTRLEEKLTELEDKHLTAITAASTAATAAATAIVALTNQMNKP
jgi:hypothetical protein